MSLNEKKLYLVCSPAIGLYGKKNKTEFVHPYTCTRGTSQCLKPPRGAPQYSVHDFTAHVKFPFPNGYRCFAAV